MGFEFGQGLKPAGGICRGSAQELGQFVRGARRETTECSTGEASNLAERLFANWIVTFLKHKRLHIAQAKLPSASA